MTMILHSTIQGEGFPAVFIHGFCEDSSIWQTVLQGLPCRKICLDLPGFGKSPLSPAQPSIDSYAHAVAHTLDSLGVGECLLFGHSLGGYVALAFARLYPARLKGLGMIHSTAFADDEAKKESREKVASFVRQHGAKPFLSGFYPNLFAERHREKFASEIARLYEEGQYMASEAIAHAALAMGGRPDSIALLASLTCPVLYTVGKQDGAVPFEKSLQQCFLPQDGIVHVWEEVGHAGMIEAPAAMQKALKGFIGYCLE